MLPTIMVASPNLEVPLFARTANVEAVGQALAAYADRLLRTKSQSPDQTLIVQVSTQRVGEVWQSSFSLSYSGIPLLERSLKVVAGANNGKIIYIENSLPAMTPVIPRPGITEAEASGIATQYLNEEKIGKSVLGKPLLAFAMIDGTTTPRLIYQIFSSSDLSAERLWIDAQNGKVLRAKDLFEYERGIDENVTQNGSSGTLTVQIHPQSPFDSLITVPLPNTTVLVNSQRTITDSLGNWALIGVLPPLSIITSFSNPFYYTEDTLGGTKNSTLIVHTNADTTLNWDDQNSNAAERDAYFHIGDAEKYALTLDTSLRQGLSAPLTINVNFHAICNAFYNPESRSVNFFHAGGSCANTAEIADIVFHEFGHRIADIRYTTLSGANIIDGSLSEGFADLVSAFMRDDPRIGIDFFGKGTILRTCDNTKKWPQDLNPDIHITGEIISGALWDLRKTIGRDTAQRLFQAMEYLHPDGTDEINPLSMQNAFLSVLMALLTADDTNNDLTDGTPHAAQILHAFSLHGIDLSPYITVLSTRVSDQDTTASGYTVAARTIYSGQIGSLDTNGVRLRYTTNHWSTSMEIPMKLVAQDSFICIIPKQTAGSLVEYYIIASTTYSDAGNGYAPSTAPSTPFAFLVGYKQTFLDDAEQDRGWSLSQPKDNAVAGLWTREVPFGTFSAPNEFVQQDTDHTPNGTMCYLTGNRNAQTQSRNISFDDVDSGFTTLTTPIYDLSKLRSPAIRFWYYYSNTAGSASGINTWKVLLSNDGGSTWKYLLDTHGPTMGWTPYLFKVSDYLLPTATIQLRFVASDTVGAIVEAGVDDLEIEEASSVESVTSNLPRNALTLELGTIHPNPATDNSVRSVQFTIPHSEHVVLQIKDVLGRVVLTPFDSYATAGTMDLSFTTTPLTSGSYWLQLTSNEGARIRSFSVLR